MQYCTWKLELVSNILRMIGRVFRVHVFGVPVLGSMLEGSHLRFRLCFLDIQHLKWIFIY